MFVIAQYPFFLQTDSYLKRFSMNCGRNTRVRRQPISYILPSEQALCQLLVLCTWYWLNGSTFHRLRVEIIMIKDLAVACSEVNFTFQFCLQLQSKLFVNSIPYGQLLFDG
jgi:hypothetical protein